MIQTSSRRRANDLDVSIRCDVQMDVDTLTQTFGREIGAVGDSEVFHILQVGVS